LFSTTAEPILVASLALQMVYVGYSQLEQDVALPGEGRSVGNKAV
jgi:hypothetical protein